MFSLKSLFVLLFLPLSGNLYLPDEMFKSKHKTYSIHFGKPIPWQTFDSSRKPAEWAEWVKEIVYNLKK